MAEHSEVPIEEITTPPEPAQGENEPLENDAVGEETEQSLTEMPATAEFVADIQTGKQEASNLNTAFKNYLEEYWSGIVPSEWLANLKKETKGKSSAHDYLKALAAHPAIAFTLMRLESIREKATGNDYSPAFTTTQEAHTKWEWLNDALPTENLGNLAESYALTFAVFFGLSIVAKDALSPRKRAMIAFFTGVAVNVAMETNYVPWIANVPDVLDIPAGIVGSLAFVGMSYLIDEFGTALDRVIDEAKKRIRESKQYFNTLDNANSERVESAQSENENLAYALATVSENSVSSGVPDGFNEQLE